MSLQSSLRANTTFVANLGLVQALIYKYRRAVSRRDGTQPYFLLYSKYAKHPVRCRPNTSDVEVFKQIFAWREYRCLDDVHDASLIIDCGANVGYSAVYFLTRYPNARVIAVEPDPDNFAVLNANVAPYGDRCRTVCAGVWSSTAGLVMSEEKLGQNLEWARTVRTAKPGEKPTITAVDIGGLLAGSGAERISILKIDIEGSEAEVFSSNYAHWLNRVDNLVIELHGPRCKQIFAAAIEPSRFAVSQCDELTVCKKAANP